MDCSIAKESSQAQAESSTQQCGAFHVESSTSKVESVPQEESHHLPQKRQETATAEVYPDKAAPCPVRVEALGRHVEGTEAMALEKT